MVVAGAIIGMVILWFNLRALWHLVVEYCRYITDRRRVVRLKREYDPESLSSNLALKTEYLAYFTRVASWFNRIADALGKEAPEPGYVQVPEGFANLSGKWVPAIILRDIGHLSLAQLPPPVDATGLTVPTPDVLLAAYERHRPGTNLIVWRAVFVAIGLALLAPAARGLL